MKELIKGRDGKHEIETEGELWGFHVGDVVSSNREGIPHWSWNSRRVVVEGFFGEHLYGKAEGDIRSESVSSPLGIILLERPGMLFKVGDSVRVAVNVTRYEKGKIVVINPFSSTPFPYLVEYFVEVEHQREPWFPKKHRLEIRLLWCSEWILSILNSRK